MALSSHINSYFDVNYLQIIAQGSTIDDPIAKLFDAYLAMPNFIFKQYMAKKQDDFHHGNLKEYAQVEGVPAELGVALELANDLSRGNEVSEMAEYCEKVPRTSVRPQLHLVPGGNGTGTRLTHAYT
jgi:hypothetical protein